MLAENIVVIIPSVKIIITSLIYLVRIIIELWFYEPLPRICIGIEKPGGLFHIKIKSHFFR